MTSSSPSGSLYGCRRAPDWMASSRIEALRSPESSRGWRTVERPTNDAISMSSNPMTDRSRGSTRPVSRAASSTPRACWSDAAKIAVGGVGEREQLDRHLTTRGPKVRAVPDVVGRHGETVGVHHLEEAGLPSRARRETERTAVGLTDEGDALVAEVDQVPGAHPSARDIVDRDRRQSGVLGVEQHGGESGVGQPLALGVWTGSDMTIRPSMRRSAGSSMSRVRARSGVSTMSSSTSNPCGCRLVTIPRSRWYRTAPRRSVRAHRRARPSHEASRRRTGWVRSPARRSPSSPGLSSTV